MDAAPPAAAVSPATTSAVDPRALRRKLMWRIVPLVFVLYFISYLDRANVAFVENEMRGDLHFSPKVFGIGVGVFFVGYLLLEIPGALIVEHWSARKWFSRILLTWGLCSMGLALVRSPWQFYLARFLLGLAEAGFFPGIIVYFTHWFPRADRGRAFAGLILGVPLSNALGAWVTDKILLDVTWFNLAGWQWVFLLEGFPALLLGVAVLLLMTDRPRQASWLSSAESEWLEETLAAERRAVAASGVTLRQILRQPAVWLLASQYPGGQHRRGYAAGLLDPRMLFSDSARRDTGTRSGRRSAVLDRPLLHFWPGEHLGGWSVVGPHRRPQVALCSRPGVDRLLPRGRLDPGAAVGRRLLLAESDRVLRLFLAAALLGAAPTSADGLGGGGGHRVHQHLRERGRHHRPSHRGLDERGQI